MTREHNAKKLVKNPVLKVNWMNFVMKVSLAFALERNRSKRKIRDIVRKTSEAALRTLIARDRLNSLSRSFQVSIF